MSASVPPLVVHVFPTFAVGGAQVRFAAIANHFGAAFRHIVVALDGNFECRERLRPDLDAVFPMVGAPKGSMFGNARRFRQMLKQWRPDVLVTGNWGAIEFAMANIPPVTRHIHVVDGFGPEERSTQIPRRIWTRRLVLARSPVVLPSRNLVRIATEVWKLNPRLVHYVPNGIDLGRFATPARAPHDGPPVIGTVAALRAEKNLARLIRAFARVVADTPARLTIVGDGEERAMLVALVAELEVADHVTFAGHRSDTPALYAGFDVFALSSDTEQMPLSAIEAMASGLPVVSTDVGDVRSMVAPDNDPFVVPLDDDALAAALTVLLRDQVRRDTIGAANLEKSRREFAEAAMFERYRALWMGEAG
jgi:glycosyltransferase involved in cell wall biosynthesis